MPKPSFQDRLLTPPVARAATSPLGILVAGAGVAVGIVAGLPLALAVGAGVVAYGVRVAVAIPRKGQVLDGINPFELDDPWRTFVWQAKKSQRQFADAATHTKDGPLRDRLHEIAERIETGVEECWRVAQSGNALTRARARIDISMITMQLSQLPTGAPLQANPTLATTAKSLQSQLDTAKRMDTIISTTQDRLRLLDARLGELVTQVIELSVRPQGLADLAAVGADVDSVVGEMAALRQALDESDRADNAVLPPAPALAPPATTPPLPAPAPAATPPVADPPAAGPGAGSLGPPPPPSQSWPPGAGSA